MLLQIDKNIIIAWMRSCTVKYAGLRIIIGYNLSIRIGWQQIEFYLMSVCIVLNLSLPHVNSPLSVLNGKVKKLRVVIIGETLDFR